MHLPTVLAFLAATVVAMPTEEPQQGEMNFIIVRKPLPSQLPLANKTFCMLFANRVCCRNEPAAPWSFRVHPPLQLSLSFDPLCNVPRN